MGLPDGARWHLKDWRHLGNMWENSIIYWVIFWRLRNLGGNPSIHHLLAPDTPGACIWCLYAPNDDFIWGFNHSLVHRWQMMFLGKPVRGFNHSCSHLMAKVSTLCGFNNLWGHLTFSIIFHTKDKYFPSFLHDTLGFVVNPPTRDVLTPFFWSWNWNWGRYHISWNWNCWTWIHQWNWFHH